MDFITWEPAYGWILDDFGLDRTDDERARDVLADLAESFGHDRLNWVGVIIAVCRMAPTLDAELDRLDDPDVGVVVATSIAADAVRDAGFDLDLMATDLDKSPETAVELTESGVPVAAHAHGDNLPAVRERVPQFDTDHVLGTTQAAPAGPTVSWDGFTDGNRAAFIVDELGVKRLALADWDFDDPIVDATKARKLRWAERLPRWLERRHDERSPVFDGRRDGIDPLPREARDRADPSVLVGRGVPRALASLTACSAGARRYPRRTQTVWPSTA